MRLDHISYATTHNQMADTIQRLGSRLKSTFIDGGIHPRFGTRNFILPMSDGLYLEVVSPLEHPSTDSTPFREAVTNCGLAGGGWLARVLSTSNILPIEKRLGRKAIEGHRVRPDGSDLQWKQVGILENIENPQLPFFIEWLTSDHPSNGSISKIKIKEIEIVGQKYTVENWIEKDLDEISNGIKFKWIRQQEELSKTGIRSVTFQTEMGDITVN